MLTNEPDDARPVADRNSAFKLPAWLALHRRIELFVALLALGAVAVLVLDAEPAAAEAGPARIVATLLALACTAGSLH